MRVDSLFHNDALRSINSESMLYGFWLKTHVLVLTHLGSSLGNVKIIAFYSTNVVQNEEIFIVLRNRRCTYRFTKK